jgi:serine/threonine protein kinase
MIGSTVSHYQILERIGEGGMGVVYKARDTRLDRTVAIKILPAHLSDKPAARDRFEREARAISALNHPSICQLYDVGSHDAAQGTIGYLVMEYLEGETLADRLARGPLPLDQVLKYGADICEALAKAHRTGVVHRDLKPGNIMVTRSGVKLMDFGLAKALPPADGAASSLKTASRALTAEGALVGTFRYMSPEQVRICLVEGSRGTVPDRARRQDPIEVDRAGAIQPQASASSSFLHAGWPFETVVKRGRLFRTSPSGPMRRPGALDL